MLETARNSLPLLEASQAQKHVTVNESLVRLDALVQSSVKSRSLVSPPLANEGDCYIVGSSPTGEWLGNDGLFAVFSNSGWIFLEPNIGWITYVEDENQIILKSVTSWSTLPVTIASTSSAKTEFNVIEFEHALSGGSSSESTNVQIPANSIVFGVTARVTQEIISNSGTAWRLGVSGYDNRYGSNLGLPLNSTALGLTGQPQAYYTDTSLLLSCENGIFNSGTISFGIHCATLVPPAGV